MTTDPSDPELNSSAASPEDDWGDAVHVVRDESGGSSVLPNKRELRERAVVTVIEGESEDSGAEAQVEDAPVATKLSVREYSGKGQGQNESRRPLRRNIEKLIKGERRSRKSSKERWEIEQTEWEGVKTFNVRWIVGISVGVIALLAGGLALLPWINSTNEGDSRQAEILRIEQLETNERVRTTEALMSSRADAVMIFNNYLSARLADDILPVLRDRKQVEPLVRSSQLMGERGLTWTSDEKTDWNILMVDGRPCAILVGVFSNYEPFAAYFVWENNTVLLDWKATTGYGTATFDELLMGQGDASEIRGILRPSVFYSVSYPEEHYQSYELIEPYGERAIWCYVKRKTKLEQIVKSIFVGGGIIQQEVQPAKVSLKLVRGTEGALGSQWLLDAVWHEEWVKLHRSHQ